MTSFAFYELLHMISHYGTARFGVEWLFQAFVSGQADEDRFRSHPGL
jgi:hypothetical protein